MATTRGSLIQTSVPNLTSASTVSGANFTLTKPKGKYEQSKKYFGPLQAAVPRPTGQTAVIYEKGGCDFRFCNLSCLGPAEGELAAHAVGWQRDVRPVRPVQAGCLEARPQAPAPRRDGQVNSTKPTRPIVGSARARATVLSSARGLVGASDPNPDMYTEHDSISPPSYTTRAAAGDVARIRRPGGRCPGRTPVRTAGCHLVNFV